MNKKAPFNFSLNGLYHYDYDLSSQKNDEYLSEENLLELEERIDFLTPLDYPDRNRILEEVKESYLKIIEKGAVVYNRDKYLSTIILNCKNSLNYSPTLNRPYLNIKTGDIISYMDNIINIYLENNDTNVFKQEFLDKLDEFVIRLLNTNFSKNFYKKEDEQLIICDRVRINFFRYLIKNKKKINNLQAYLRIVIKGNCASYIDEQYKKIKTVSLEEVHENLGKPLDFDYLLINDLNKMLNNLITNKQPFEKEYVEYDIDNIRGILNNLLKKVLKQSFKEKDENHVLWLLIHSVVFNTYFYLEKYFKEGKEVTIAKIYSMYINKILLNNKLEK